MKNLLYWLSAAFSVFVNGFLDNWHGFVTGAGVGGGFVHATTVLPEWEKIGYTILSAFVAPALGGVNEVVIWRRTNPFPNLFPNPKQNENVTPPVIAGPR